MKQLFLLLLAVLVLTGCAQFILPSAKQLEALSKDKNRVRIKAVTVWGTVDLDRNMGDELPTTNSGSLLVTPTTTLQSRSVK